MPHTRTSAAPRSKHTPTRPTPHATCGFAECTRHHYAKGFCNSHYKQLQQGRPLAPLQKLGGSQPKPVIPRLLKNVLVNGKPYGSASESERTNSCWIWDGSKNSNGYGQMYWNGGMVSTHRVSYEVLVGPVEAESVHHRCRTKDCVNPQHLELATMRENVGEMFARKAYEKTIGLQRSGILEVLQQVEERLLQLSTADSDSPAVCEEVRHLETLRASLRDIPMGTQPATQHAPSSRSRTKSRCRK